ncbi:MAG TPA: tetratricopeptide repeat protein [Pyrinomonadaceae bacterium]|nr:tetratricopeptide repeat protein [Pyrinomonadaceae bacterium]
MPHRCERPRRRAASVAALVLLASFIFYPPAARAQVTRGQHTLYGDFKVDESRAVGMVPISFDILLYTETGLVVERQSIGVNSRFRFINLVNGVYDIAVEVEGREVARTRVNIFSLYKNDFRQDIALAWSAPPGGPRPGTVDASAAYRRGPANQQLFERADSAAGKKDYEGAAALLRKLVEADPADYPAWTELGTMNYAMGEAEAAEDAYLRALKEKPDFLRAAINLGRLRIAMKKFEPAIEVLAAAAEKHPRSADANLLLGEAYLQVRKGSKAVPHLNEAARLGRPEAHLRLATLYNAAGLKDRAAAEYEQLLSKEPKHPERERLLRYIAENKKR